MDQTVNSSQNGKAGFDLFATWQEYQKVAMHFNDLLIRIRSQSLAAVAAFATIAGVAVKGDSINTDLRWGILTGVFAILSIFWLAMWILDFKYYNRLLLGAVNALIAIEEASKSSSKISELYLSTKIEATVKENKSPTSRRFLASEKTGRWAFYILVFTVLITGTIISSCNWRK
jgi:hypothetical protein